MTEAPKPASSGLPLADEVTEFTYYNVIYPKFSAAASAMVDDWADTAVMKELAARTNVRLVCSNLPIMSAAQQFGLMVAANELTDLLTNGEDWYQGGSAAGVRDGYFIDIAKYFDSCPNYERLITSNESVRLTAFSEEGTVGNFYQILNQPLYMEGLGIRSDWLREVGMDIPTTQEELHDVLAAFAAAGHPGAYLFNGTSDEYLCAPYDIYARFDSRAGEFPLYVKDGEVRCSLTEDALRDYVSLIRRWNDDGLVNVDSFFGTADGFMINDKVATGEIGVTNMELGNLGSFGDMIGGDAEFEAIPVPTLTAGQATHMSRYGDLTEKGCYQVAASSRDIPLLVSFIDYCYSDEGYYLCNYGIEGESYNMVYGKPEYTALITNNPDGLTVDDAIGLYAWQWGFFCTDNTRLLGLYGEKELNALERWGSNVDNAWRVPTAMSLSADASAEVSNIFADISTYAEESLLKFMRGDQDLSGWDDYVATLEGMNVARMVELYQAAYDQYVNK